MTSDSGGVPPSQARLGINAQVLLNSPRRGHFEHQHQMKKSNNRSTYHKALRIRLPLSSIAL
jgi:hypothetical protein